METKKLGLGLLAVFSVLLLVGVVYGAHAVDPASGEVGTTVTITLDTADADTDYNITFTGNDDFAEIIPTDADGNGAVDVIVPEATAGEYTFSIDTALVTNLTYEVLNTAPEVGTLDDTKAVVGEDYTGHISFTDDNGDKLATGGCSLEDSSGPDNLNIRTKADKTECELYFTDGEPDGEDVGSYDLIIKVKDAEGDWSEEEEISFTVADFLEITDIDIDDKTGDDDDHMPGDEIKITITVENNGDEEIQDIEVEIDSSKLDLNKEFDAFDLDDGKDKELTYTFTIPYDTEEDTYTIDVSAKGEDKDSNTDREASYEFDLTTEQEKHAIAIDDLAFSLAKATCGDAVDLTFDVVNTGREDEDITVTIRNTKLGIDISLDEFDLSSGDYKAIEETINVPDNAYDGTFAFDVTIKADSESDSQDITLTLEDCDSDLITVDKTVAEMGAGENIELRINIENIGSIKQNYKLEVLGVSDFGTYNVSVDDEAKISVDAGETKEVIVTITADEDAVLNAYDVDLEVYLGSDEIGSVTVPVAVKKTSWLTGFGVFGGDGAETGLSFGIILAIAVIGYLAYQIWFKRKKKLDEDTGSIIFEEDKKK